MSDQVEIGQIVRSKKGRDKDNYFVVVAAAGDEVCLADGMTRRLAAPKKKNVKHVKCCGAVSETITQKLSEGKKVFDSEIKSALKHLSSNGQAINAAAEEND